MKTKYPIVLVHGIALKDFRFLKSFGQIDRILRIQGYKVYKAQIDGFGSVINNANQLKEEILRILEIEHVDKVNIIAHSKGGLDSKYMIKHLGMEDMVASLTTLCTPHKGSPIATNILKLPHSLTKITAFWINFWYKLFGDKHPDSYQACQDLQRVDSLEEEILNFSSKVYCQSYSTEMIKSRDDFIMGIPLIFSKRFEVNIPSDGVVPEDSTVFGEYKGHAVDGSISHTEIVDFMVMKKKQDKIYMFYSMLCEELVNKGF